MTPAAAVPPIPVRHVVLLHGIWASPVDMMLLARALRRQGYVVHNIGYLSMRRGIPAQAQVIADTLRRRGLADTPDLALIGHSMGGLVIRALMARADAPRHVTRILLLGTPNAGSAWVDLWRGRRVTRVLFDLIYGPAGRELSPQHPYFRDLYPTHLPCPVGVIAGRRGGILPHAGAVLGPEHDGLVAVASTRLAGADHVMVDASHPFIMDIRAAQAQVLHFLAQGRFDHKITNQSGV